MNIIHNTIRAIMKQPFLLVLAGGLMLFAAVLNMFFPAVAMITGLIRMTGGGVFGSVISIVEMLLDPGLLPTVLIALMILALLVSVVSGLFLPGFLLTVESALEEGGRKHGLFLQGLRAHFLSFFVKTLKAFGFLTALTVFLMVASIPAIVITRVAIASKPDLMIAAVFLDIVTIAVMFLCLSFAGTYLSMWFTAAASGVQHPFRSGKAAADRRFWSMAFIFLAFDIVFCAVFYLIYLSGSQIFRYAAGWSFTTLYFTALSVYLVSTYRENA